MAKFASIAASKSSVLITGESGTRKEMMAYALRARWKKSGWRLKEASQQLGIGRSTLWRKVKLFGINQKS